jgi:hypothetical protein
LSPISAACRALHVAYRLVLAPAAALRTVAA